MAVNQLTNALSLLNDAAHRVIEAKSYNGWHSAYRSVGFVPEAVDSQPNPTRPFSKPKLTLDIILSDSRLHNTIVFSLDGKW